MSDLISRDTAIANAQEQKALYDETASTGNPSQSHVAGRMSAACESIIKALRAIPAAPEAGEVEELRGAQIINRNAIRMQREGREKAESRLAEAEAERDNARVQLAGAYEAAAQYIRSIAKTLRPDSSYSPLAEAITCLTPADATAASEHAVEARVQAALAAQGEPVAWEATTPGYRRFISDSTYRGFSDEARRWYKPYRCSSCAALTTAQSAEGGGVGDDQRAVTERMSRRRYAAPTAQSAEGGE